MVITVWTTFQPAAFEKTNINRGDEDKHNQWLLQLTRYVIHKAAIQSSQRVGRVDK